MLVELRKGEWINSRKIAYLKVEDNEISIRMDKTCESPYDYYRCGKDELVSWEQFESALLGYEPD